MTICVSCGSTNLEFVSKYLHYGEKFRELFPELTILNCQQCNLLQVDHSSIDEQKLTDYYRYFYRKEIDFVSISKGHHVVWNERGCALARIAAQHIKLVNVSKIFEVGAGYGYNLMAFQKQFENAQLFTDELASNLLPQSVTQANLEDGPYDIIIMSHVLEHLMYPKEFVLRVARNLQQGGLLVIEVPNEGNGQFVYQQKNGIPFHTGHLTFFSEKVLRLFFHNNFKELCIKQFGTAGPTTAKMAKLYMLNRISYRLLGIFPPLLRGAERLYKFIMERKIATALNFSNDTDTFDKVFLRIVLIREDDSKNCLPLEET